MRWMAAVRWFGGGLTSLVLAAGCGGAQSGQTGNTTSSSAAASTSALESRSSVTCHADVDCGICYRANTCGDSVSASDPGINDPTCHVSPAPFCMPRRALCEAGRCVAR